MSKDAIALLTFTLITIIAWIGFDIYHKNIKITLSEEVQKQMEPLNPNLDIEFIQELKALEQR